MKNTDYRVIDARTLAKRNIATNSAAQTAVRPGLRRLKTASSLTYEGGFSVNDAQTGALYHYLVTATTSAPYSLTVIILDEHLTQLDSTTIEANAQPRVVSHGRILSHIVMGGPDLPTQWCLVGNGVRVAEKADHETLSTIEMPQGLFASWMNRIVQADGSTLRFSVPVAITGGSPRTFLGANQVGMRGGIFGLHTGAGGMLVICTDVGVYGLDPSAAAVAIVNSSSADIRLLSHHRTTTFQSTCEVNGRVYGLTKNGFRLIDVESAPEIDLDDPLITRAFEKRISLGDYREARMFPGEGGPIIGADSIPALWVTEEQGGISSWWTAASDVSMKLRGVLRDVDGTDLLVMTDGIYVADGNFDGTQALTSGFATQPTGFFHGEVPTGPHENETVKHVYVSAADGDAKAALRGDSQTSTSYRDSIYGAVEGSSSWGGSWRYVTTPTVAHRLDFDVNSNDLAVEAGVTGCGNRIQPVVTLEMARTGKNRPQDRG